MPFLFRYIVDKRDNLEMVESKSYVMTEKFNYFWHSDKKSYTKIKTYFC